MTSSERGAFFGAKEALPSETPPPSPVGAVASSAPTESNSVLRPVSGNGTGPAPAVAHHWRRNLLLAVMTVAAAVLLDRATLLFVPPQYRSLPDARRYHELYYSQKFRQFERVKENLQIVVMGDSRTRHGVDPELFPSHAGQKTVTAFNLAPASSGVAFTDLIVREYLLDLPRIQTVVWGVSPRVFNAYWEDPVYDLFKASSGYRHDLAVREIGWSKAGVAAASHVWFDAMMSTLFASYAHRSILKAEVLDAITSAGQPRRFTVEPPLPMNDWGFVEFPPARMVNFGDPKVVQGYMDALKGGRFKLAPDRWELFRGLVAELERRKIRLVCFVPPMNNLVARTAAADADGTPKTDYREVIARLKSLEDEFGNFRLSDINNAGENGFADAEFGDMDHLNPAGAAHLSELVAKAILAPAGTPNSPAAGRVEAPQQQPTGPSTPAVNPTKVGQADTTPPQIRGMLGELDYGVRSFPPDNRPDIWAEYSDAESGVDLKSVRLFVDDADVTAQCKIAAGRITWKPEKTLESPKLYRFKITVSDKAGNKAELVWEILLQPC